MLRASSLVRIAGALVASSFFGLPASADVSIMFEESGFANQTFTSPTGLLSVPAGTAFGDFVFVQSSAIGQPVLPNPAVLTGTIGVSGAANKTFTILVTSTGNVGGGLLPFISRLAENRINGGGTVIQQTFADAANTAFGMTTVLSPAAAFTTSGFAAFNTSAVMGALYSNVVTEGGADEGFEYGHRRLFPRQISKQLGT